MLRDQVQSLVGEPKSHKAKIPPPPPPPTPATTTNKKMYFRLHGSHLMEMGKRTVVVSRIPHPPQPENILGPMVKEIKIAYRMRVTNQPS